MKGKINCTCGWSWNKSDSSKKDMYICHECGRDNSNNMKNGGWLDNYGEQENYNDFKVSAPEGMIGDGFSNVGRNYSPAWGGQFQTGGKLKFLQPTSDKLPEGYRIPYDTPSTERAGSIGGTNGEPAYLIPEFKYGHPIYDPIEEFKRTGEHLGGPFKTWQEADEWENTVRHPAVENRETIMFPQEKFAMGGSIPGSVGFTYARTKGIPSEGPYAKKTLPSAQNGVDMYGNPIIADLKYDQSVNRTNYNPRTNQMIFGHDMPLFISQEQRDKTLAHENRHAWQFNNDRTNFDIVHNPEYAFQERLKKKPESPSTDEVFNTYHNRKQKEVELDVKAFKMNNPDLAFMPDEIVYKKFVDSMQYNNPNSVEGEAQYYENTGKKSFKNGGWLDKHDVAQNGYITGDKVKYGTPEYTEAYNKGEVVTDEGGRSPIQLDEVVIQNNYKRPRGFWEQYRDKIVEENKDAGVLGAAVGVPISAVFSLPQLAMMKGLTGEMQRPSEAVGFDNNEGLFESPLSFGKHASNFVLDAVTDPANLIGAGILTKENALSKLGSLKNIKGSVTSKLKQGLRSDGLLDTFKKKPNFQSGINTMEELPPLPEDFLTKIKKLQESSKSINMLKEDLADPETIRRAEALGIDPEIFAEASKNMTYSSNRDVPSSYSSSDLEININPNQTGRTPEEAIMSGVMDSHSPNFTANEIGAHELGHFFQDTNYWKNPYPKTLSGFDRVMAHAKDLDGKPLSNILDYHSKYSTRNTAPTKVDEMLKDLQIRTGLDKEYYPQKNKNYFVDANKQYGTDVDNMIEKFPMFREYRQGMRDLGILKNKWDEITPEHIEDFRKLKPENRLNSFMEFNDKNYKLLNEVSKIAPAVLPIGLGLGTASQLEQKREGGIIKDDRGQWEHPGEITEIGSNQITMQGVPYDVLGISDTGDTKLMKPGQNYKFKGKKVTEFPMAKNGMRQEQKGLVNLDQLTNFTNYNKPQPGGWLNKYN